jgi:hypothetical protein
MQRRKFLTLGLTGSSLAGLALAAPNTVAKISEFRTPSAPAIAIPPFAGMNSKPEARGETFDVSLCGGLINLDILNLVRTHAGDDFWFRVPPAQAHQLRNLLIVGFSDMTFTAEANEKIVRDLGLMPERFWIDGFMDADRVEVYTSAGHYAGQIRNLAVPYLYQIGNTRNGL